MSKSIPITIEAAARLISRNDARLVDAADRLLSWALLLSPAITGNAAGLALLDPKNELIRLTRQLITGAQAQAKRRSGVSRTELLRAAQTLTAVAALFEAVAFELGQLYQQLELTDYEKTQLATRTATSQQERLHGHAQTLAHLTFPALDASRGWEEALLAYHQFYIELAALLGGEEFALLLEGRDQSVALRIAEELRTRISAMRVQTEKQRLKLTCSFGVSQWEPGDTIDRLLKRADIALYSAKSGGRNRVVAFNTELIAGISSLHGRVRSAAR
jgi:hypothetical protein